MGHLRVRSVQPCWQYSYPSRSSEIQWQHPLTPNDPRSKVCTTKPQRRGTLLNKSLQSGCWNQLQSTLSLWFWSCLGHSEIYSKDHLIKLFVYFTRFHLVWKYLQGFPKGSLPTPNWASEVKKARNSKLQAMLRVAIAEDLNGKPFVENHRQGLGTTLKRLAPEPQALEVARRSLASEKRGGQRLASQAL